MIPEQEIVDEEETQAQLCSRFYKGRWSDPKIFRAIRQAKTFKLAVLCRLADAQLAHLPSCADLQSYKRISTRPTKLQTYKILRPYGAARRNASCARVPCASPA